MCVCVIVPGVYMCTCGHVRIGTGDNDVVLGCIHGMGGSLDREKGMALKMGGGCQLFQ